MASASPTEDRSDRSRIHPVWAFAALLAVTLAAYGPALRGGFIWDDDAHVTKPELRSWSGLGRIWLRPGATQQYYPVLHSAFWLEHRLWGDAAVGYHLLNVLLHVTAAWLFVLVLQRLTSSDRPDRETLARSATRPAESKREGDSPAVAERERDRSAVAEREGDSSAVAGREGDSAAVAERASVSENACWLAGLLFALHPVGVESVAWISEQKNTLSTVFYLLAALTYLRFDRSGVAVDLRATVGRPAAPPAVDRLATPKPGEVGRSTATYILATALFVLAILSKSVTCTLPAALLVVQWWRRGRLEWKRDVIPLLPWFGLGIAGGLWTAYVERHFLGAEGASFGLSLLERGMLAGRVFWFYLGKLLWPQNLIFIYPHWMVSARAAGQHLFPLAAAALFAALWAARRRCPALLAGFLFFAGTLFPALGFFNVYPFMFSYVADHFQYLASLGILGLVAAGWGRLEAAGTGRRGVWNAAALAVVALLGVLTWRQCRDYRGAEPLYRATLAKNPDCWLMAYNLGVVLDRDGRRAEAQPQYERALRLKPDLADAHNNLGVLLAQAGRIPEAEAQYRAAIDYDEKEAAPPAGEAKAGWYRTEEAKAVFNLGNAVDQDSRKEEAVGYYREALRLNPRFDAAYAALGRTLSGAGESAGAIELFEKALSANPDNAVTHNDLGVALHNAGRNEEAAAQFEAAIRLNPGLADAQLNLANIRRQQHRMAEAVAGYAAALKIKPDYGEAEVYLGVTLAESGHPAEALAWYEKALQSHHPEARLNYTLGLGFRDLERYGEAIECFRRALQAQPDYPEAENDWGIAAAQGGHPAEAVEHFEAALRLRPDFSDARTNLGLVRQALGQKP